MAIPLGQPIDFNLLELLNATAQNLAAAPPHRKGRFYYDTTLDKLGISDGATWTYLGEQQAFDVEMAQDVVAAMLAGSTGVTATYNDTAGTISLVVSANSITNAMVNSAAAISADKLADGTTNKLLTATERTKLSGVAAGATANNTDAYLLARANQTGTQSADTVVDGTANKVYTAAEKIKLAAINQAATVNATDAALRDRATHTGTQSADTIIDGTANKVLTAALATKLAGVATGATANATDAFLLARGNQTGTQSADTLVDGTTNKAFTAAEDAKLAGIAAAATANSTDAALRARASHTGTQLASTISDLDAVISAAIAVTVGAAPTALDTLKELADALGNDPTFAATMASQLGLKANLSAISAVGLSGQYSALLGKPLYTQTIGDGSATSFVLTHNQNTRAVVVDVAQAAAPFASVLAEVQKTSVNTVTILFAVAPTVGQYLVTVQA